MTEQIIYDRVWLDGYLDQLKQYEGYMELVKDNLFHARTSILPEQTEIYLSVMRELDKIQYNFQIMHQTVEKFMDEAQICASELERFSEGQVELKEDFIK